MVRVVRIPASATPAPIETTLRRLGYSPAERRRTATQHVAAQHPLWSTSVRNIGACLGVNASALDALLLAAAAGSTGSFEAAEYRLVRLRSLYARTLLPDDETADLLLPASKRGRRTMRSSLQEVFRKQLRTAGIDFDTSEPCFRVLAWSRTGQGRALFLPGLGKFDVRAAYMQHWAAEHEQEEEQQQQGQAAGAPVVPLHALLPSPFELQAAAYLPLFAGTRSASVEADARVTELLACAASAQLQGSGAGSEFAPRYLIRFRDHFNGDARWANRLDELSAPGSVHLAERPELRRIPGAAALPPPALFGRLDALRAAALAGQPRPPNVPFWWLESAPSPAMGRRRLRVLACSDEVHEVGAALRNCAADYVDAVRARRCVLAALHDGEADPQCARPLGLGELDPADPSRWRQLSGPRNAGLPEETRAACEQGRRELAAWLTGCEWAPE